MTIDLTTKEKRLDLACTLANTRKSMHALSQELELAIKVVEIPLNTLLHPDDRTEVMKIVASLKKVQEALNDV